jgi:erythromycin esterase
MTRDREELIAYVRRHHAPVHGIALDLPPDDLEVLRDIVGRARIVGVGESWHYSHEILSVEHRIIRFLVEQLGFNAVIFEGSLPGSEYVDSYALGGAGTAATILRKFGQPMWLNVESVALINWIRSYNAAVPTAKKVRVFGMDPVYPAAAITSVLAYFNRVDPDRTIPHRALIARVEKGMRSIPVGSLVKSAVWGSTAVCDQLSTTEREQYRSSFADLVAALELNRAKYIFSSSITEYEWIHRQAIVVLQAYNVNSVRTRSLSEGNEARDFAFAENLFWLMAQLGPDTRAVIAAHNMHVAKEPFRSTVDGPPVNAQGTHLAKWMPHDYIAIGTAVGRGRIRGMENEFTGFAQYDADKRALVESSTDMALEELGQEYFLTKVPSNLKWTMEPHILRSHLDPQPQYTLARSFDALFYLDHIAKTEPPLFPDAAPG